MTKTFNTGIEARQELKFYGVVEYEGEMRKVEITKIDTKNNVVSFTLNIFGKKLYIASGANTPKLEDFESISVEFVETVELETAE